MRIDILTLFPEMFSALSHSMIGRAVSAGTLTINIVNIRDYSEERHGKCDDTPYGGGAGMVMMATPIANCINALDPDHRAHRIYMSPKGRTLCQAVVTELAEREHLMLLCGHYEGVDQRVLDHYMDDEISIGDYCLTGGELAAQVVCDSVARYVPGVLGNSETTSDESFADGLLEYPHYTRPRVFEGESVPDVLVSGNHAEVDKWRKARSLEITRQRRADLLKEKD